MSKEALTWAFSLKMKMVNKFVLVAMADYADDKGSCNPAHKKTAERVGASVSTVRRAVNELEAGGYLRRSCAAEENGRQTSNRYFLNIGCRAAEAYNGRGTGHEG